MINYKNTVELEHIEVVTVLSLIRKRHLEKIKEFLEIEGEKDYLASYLKEYLSTNNPFYLLEIDSPASEIFYEALNIINWHKISIAILASIEAEELKRLLKLNPPDEN